MWCPDYISKDGYVRQDDSDLWVCAKCAKPHKLLFGKITNMRAPYNATAILSYKGREDGTAIMTFATSDQGKVSVMYYNPYPPKVDMTSPVDLLNKFWKDLDDCIDQIRGDQTDAHLIELEKVRAKTYAEVLAEIMSPFYDSSEAVLRESMSRWQARQEGVKRYTPGLAEDIWDPNTRFDGTPYSRANEARVRSGGKVAVAERPTGNKIPDNLQAQLKVAIEQGMFTVKQIANTYSMNEQEVREQLGLA